MISKSLIIISRVLEFIGKPFYKAITLIAIAALFLLYHLGQLIKGVVLTTFKLSTLMIYIIRAIIRGLVTIKLPQLPRLRLRPLPKLKLPKIKLPEISYINIKFALAFILLLFCFWAIVLKDLPSPKELVTRDQEVSTKIYDRNGILLYKIYKDQNRSIIDLEEIPDHVILATLAAEDAEFYSHPGFSVKGIARAFLRNIKEKKLTGGSTITQQLVKNALLSSEKTLIRKIRELILAVEVELYYTKDEILEMYLNEVSYGGTAYGIQEASRIYFDKDVSKLTLAEAGFLAGLPKSPTKFSPFGSTPELGLDRQKDVINLMVVNKFITRQKAQEIQEEKLVFKPNKTNIKAPHFVMYVRQILEEKYSTSLIEKRGLEVKTTLDYSIQLLAEEVVRNELARLTSLNVTNAAVLVIESQTGNILAMVGSRDYFDLENDGNVNVTTATRNPGSSIKTINYAYALSNDFGPATILKDTPITFKVPGLPPYSPRNYDNRFRGNLSLRSAFAESRNVAAVKVLASYGVDKMLELGRLMGITTWNDPADYGLSLTLGGGGVKLIDLAEVYLTITNYGNRLKLTNVLEITNYKGKVLEKADYEKDNVIDPRVAFLLIDILKDNLARSPAFGSRSTLVIPNHPEVAVKTGTSNDLRDNLTVGFNQDYLVAVWVGNNDNSPMARVASGVTGASPIWNKIMSTLLVNQESKTWPVPERMIQVSICSLTGTLPCQGCPTKIEWFLEENVPTKRCSTESVEKITEEGRKPKLLPEAASTERD